ncbi:MAG: selenocysteine-specific translation elongation factor [Pirellulaceae bacterium]|nr:selenocysteine-specific translation elongation factor [Pirellulaceae bacterium]
MSYTIVGVIGHIDHGKTTLVGTLTGVDTDTHPEEKRRGITIDLGFAAFRHGDDEFALIDAPGHQKYIGNLLAGVSAIDVGLLVVACDQGIQTQTLEHAAILHNLGVSKLVVAISRIDLSDNQTLAELTEELQVFLADYGYNDPPALPISSVTGAGIDELKQTLAAFARDTPRDDSGPFRLPIDRVFSVPGRGCVVAGTVWSGTVAIGDTLHIAGRRDDVRVRELEVHGESVQQSKIGRRTAMNITGVSANELSRGDELVAQGSHQATTQHVVVINMFRETSNLKCPATVQMHSATTACRARITGVRQLTAGHQTVAVIETDQPIVATATQQFLLRRPYPVGSFAGGRFIISLPTQQSRKRGLVQLGEKLLGADAADRLLAWADYWGEIVVDPAELGSVLGLPSQDIDGAIESLVQNGRLERPTADRVVSLNTLTRVRDFATKLLTQQAQETDDAWMVEESLVDKLATTGSPKVAKLVINRMIDDQQLVRLNHMVAIASDETKLSKKQRARMNHIIDLYANDRTPPTIKEAAEKMDTTVDIISSPVRFATQQRLLTDLGNGFLIATDVFEQMCGELQALFDQQGPQTVTQIKDVWKVTRKHAIPLLEYCDKIGVTTRQGNQRAAGPKLSEVG